MINSNPKEDAFWKRQEKEMESREKMRTELSTYIENSLNAGELPTFEEFIDTHTYYHPSEFDRIERHFDEALKGFQGTMEVQAG